MSAVAIIQARMSSTRLPGKVLMPLADKPLIWHIYQRALQCREVTQVYIATSSETSDDPLAEFCRQQGLNLYRGSLDNVLQRFLDIYQLEPASRYLVRITGDCPLIEPAFIDNQLQALRHFNADICWIEKNAVVLEGQGAMSWRALHKVAEQSSHKDDREHVGSPWIADHPEEFRIVEIKLPAALQDSNYRLTVDERQDYLSMQAIYENLWQGRPLTLKKVLHWLQQHPEAMRNSEVIQSAINSEVQKKRQRWAAVAKAGQWEFHHD